MNTNPADFKDNAGRQLGNAALQHNLRRFGGGFALARQRALEEIGDLEGLRRAGADIRDRTLGHLDLWLERFESQATAAGVTVHWAETGQAVNAIVNQIARAGGVRRVIKSKSMVSEETGLNASLEKAGLAVIETDLGEYILQLAGEAPSHLIAPAIHKSREEVAILFSEHHHRPLQQDIPALCQEAREILRPHFLGADMGISGANFLIAETGEIALVTNEGNGRLVTTLPRIHVAITGIEKVIPNRNDLAVLLRLLPRSATGQSITNYVSILAGPHPATELEGPRERHVVLVDSGRTRLLGTPLEPALRCIRCGACMNHCPVYQNIGGHAYGWVYPGPIGSVLTPAYLGLAAAQELPQAATLCGACEVVCPVKIPLPDLIRSLREQALAEGLRPRAEERVLRLWRMLVLRPRLYARATGLILGLWRALVPHPGLMKRLPGVSGWTAGRELPTPERATFRQQYRERRR